MGSKSAWNAILALPALAVLAAAAVAPPARAADPAASADYRQGPTSSWVEVGTPAYDAAAPAGDVVDGAYILLYDRQFNVRARGHEYYQHLVTRAINESGAESRSQLTVYVDPGYQHLTLHWLRVYRDGRLHDRLAQSRVTVLPVESELQNRIYSGEQSINLLIPDLRAGDVLDYAYTLDSVSPNFPGHFATSLDFVWSEPVHHQRIRVRHESRSPVRYRVHGGEAEPVVRERGGHRELRFEWREVTARQNESDVPDSHVFWPYVEFSNMSDWSELARITADMYRRESVTGPLTQSRIASLKTMAGSVEDRVLAALRMVQDEVRYASISIGPGSFRPSRPDVVLERNFGDCKDKSLLVASLLRSIGVDAKPALVHSARGRALPDALPTPYAFDHAIVRLDIDGRVLWVDPTVNLQRGSLAKQAQADFGHALVIDPTTTGLEAMPQSPPDARAREIDLLFDLGAGIDKPATLVVTSRYDGLAADELRRDLATRDRVERESDYLNYYASYYPALEIGGPMTVTDDPARNVITTRENYRLVEPFTERDDVLTFELYPDELYGYTESPSTPVRTSPLAITYPAKVTQRIEVRLPEPWTIRNTSKIIENPAFRYRSTTRYRRNVLKLEYRYEALADQVALADLPRYLRDIKRMSDDLGMELTYDREAGSVTEGAADWPVAAVIAGLLAGIWLALRFTMRHDPPPRALDPSVQAPVGLGGWLIVPTLNLVVLVVVMLVSVVALCSFALLGVWEGLPASVAESMATWVQPALVILLGTGCLLLPSAIAIVVLYFRKRSSAPLFVIAVLWIASIYITVSHELTMQIAPDEDDRLAPFWVEAARDMVFLLIWTVYLLRSRRVKATFVRRLLPEAAMASPPAAPPAPAA